MPIGLTLRSECFQVSEKSPLSVDCLHFFNLVLLSWIWFYVKYIIYLGNLLYISDSNSRIEKNGFHLQISLDSCSANDAINEMLIKIPKIVNKFQAASNEMKEILQSEEVMYLFLFLIYIDKVT